MKNKLALLGGVIVVIVLVVILSGRSSGLIGNDSSLVVFGSSEAKSGLLYIPFLETTPSSVRVSVSLDADANGDFSESEVVVKDWTLQPKKDWKNSVPIKLGSLPTIGTLLKVSVGGKEYLRKLGQVQEDTTDLLELSKVTNPEESMKGWSSAIALAQGTDPATEATRYDVPDLGQRIAECAPTAAANSIISLAEEHGVSLSDLPTGTEIVDGLKGDMDWTPENGVLPNDFVEGKNKWAAKNGLPIRTEKVGDQHGRNTLQNILDAMAAEGGAAAEVRLKFADANGKVTGGHMVTVVGVRVVGDQTFIDVNDPRTPPGTDTYEVSGNVIDGYPYDGIAVVSWGFVQRWEGTPTGAALDPMTEAEIQGIQEFVGEKEKIKVIIVNGKKVPLAQVHIGQGPECDSETKQYAHYHANTGSATALDGTVLTDPGGCGFGKVKDIPVEEVVARSGAQTSPPPSSATPKAPGGTVKVCGLPGGEPCPTR